MRDTLQAETRVMGETEQLLQDTAAKTAQQAKNVDSIDGGFGSSSPLGGGIVERSIRMVLPSPVASVLLNSLGAIVALVKTVLWVLMILAITACTLAVILMRRKASEVTIEEETSYL